MQVYIVYLEKKGNLEFVAMKKQTIYIIISFAVVKLILHLLADSHSGFQGDELLHIDTGNHLAFGYMEFPPLIGLIAYMQNLVSTTSVYWHHISVHIASIIILVYVAKIVVAIGGGNRAVFVALLCIIIAPGFGRSQQLFQPVVFSQLVWVLSFYQFLLFVQYCKKRNLQYLTILVILGFSTKYDFFFFAVGLTTLLYYKPTRTAMQTYKWGQIVLVVLFALLPNIIWQVYHNYPALQMATRLYDTQLNKITRVKNITNLVLSVNPLLLIIIMAAVMFFCSKMQLRYKPIGYAILISFLVLLCTNGKSYYYFPIVLTLIPFGSVRLEHFFAKQKTYKFVLFSVLLFVGVLLIPFGMPVYSFAEYKNLIQKYETKNVAGGTIVIKYDEYYANHKWDSTMQLVKAVYDSLPNAEKQQCLIWGKHYAQVGAVNFYKSKYSTPPAFSLHGSNYNWLPMGNMPSTVIGVSYRVGKFFEQYFKQVQIVKQLYNPYSDNEEELYQYIYVCKQPLQTFDELKVKFRSRVFE